MKSIHFTTKAENHKKFLPGRIQTSPLSLLDVCFPGDFSKWKPLLIQLLLRYTHTHPAPHLPPPHLPLETPTPPAPPTLSARGRAGPALRLGQVLEVVLQAPPKPNSETRHPPRPRGFLSQKLGGAWFVGIQFGPQFCRSRGWSCCFCGENLELILQYVCC